MTCNHDNIPEGSPISTTRVMRCREDHLYRIHYYFCYLSGTDLVFHAKQPKYLAYCNLRLEIKNAMDEELRAFTEKQIEKGLPIDAAILISEMPPGFEYEYALRMKARYNWNKGKGNYTAAEEAEAR